MAKPEITENVLQKRRAGILLHITSLPSNYGNGDLGAEAYHFIDFLQSTGITVWQTLPLGYPHEDLSPYQCLSAHAGNPALINIDWLEKKGWLKNIENCYDCQYGTRYLKNCLISKAYSGFQEKAPEAEKNAYSRFCQEHAFWLDDFVLFLALKKVYGDKTWNEWPACFRDRDEQAILKAHRELSSFIEIAKFEQFVFFSQWHELKDYAHQHGVLMFGDIPIFVAYDSADVWAHPEVFKLDSDGKMTVVAGVPPDYFSATGQHWGNPHYNWQKLEETGFKWWLNRMRTQIDLFDIIRIDHFRGLEAAWEIPAEDDTAINGRWVNAPGDALLTTIFDTFGHIPLVAEDLGIITDEVEVLRDKFNLPGMKVLQFAFGGGADNPYLPHNYHPNCVVYTGTHDNDTTVGWFSKLSEQEKHVIQEYLGDTSESIPYALIQTAFASVANMAVIPMQDVLVLNSDHRMNTPGTIEGNWIWRFSWNQLNELKVKKLTHLVELFDRGN